MMKMRFKIFLTALLILSGCGYVYKSNFKPGDLTTSGIDDSKAYLFGTYDYVVRTPIFFGAEPHLALGIIPKDGDGKKEIIISMNADKGYFFTYLEPGEYTLKRIIFYMANSKFNSVPVNKDFRMENGKVFYFGSVRPKVLWNTQNYIWWGVKSLENDFQKDVNDFTQIFNGIKTESIMDGFSLLAASIKPFEKRDIYEGGSRGVDYKKP